MEKQNWANIEDEEEDYDEQEHRDSQYQESQEQTTEQQSTESRPPGFGQGQRENRGQYGNRGQRGGGRGGRGRGGNSRGGGPRDQKKPQRENQSEEEMMNFVKRSQDKNVFINLFNVDYKVEEDQIKSFYNDVNIVNINRLGQGLFLVELEKNEAIKMIELGTGELNGRRFLMRMGYSNKQQNPDDQWHHVNSASHQRDLARHQDKDKRGGYNKPYNRREQGDYHDDGFKKPYNKLHRHRDDAPKEDAPIDTNNKFFKDHDPSNTEFKPRFFTSKANKPAEGGATHEESGDTQAKVNKPNPFGAAVARDESEYLKKKEEEKGQVQDLKENFEEKKEEVAKDTNISPSNTPDIEAEQNKPKSQGPPGFTNKKFTNKGRQEKPSAPQTKQPEPVQQQPKGGDKGKKDNAKKTNIFDLLNE